MENTPMTRTTAGTPWIHTSIHAGILSSCGAEEEEVTGPEVSLLMSAISGTINPGARSIKPHYEHTQGQVHGICWESRRDVRILSRWSARPEERSRGMRA